MRSAISILPNSAAPTRRLGQRRTARPGPRARVGARQHRGVRRRSRQRHDLRALGRRREVRDADGHAGGARACFIASSRRADSRSPRAASTTATTQCAALLNALGLDRTTSRQLRTLPMEQIVKVSRAPAYLGPVKDGRLAAARSVRSGCAAAIGATSR